MVRLTLGFSCLSVAAAGILPVRDILGDSIYNGGTLSTSLKRRGEFGPISTSSAAEIAGGQVVCDAAPVESFFAGLKPPVCNPLRN